MIDTMALAETFARDFLSYEYWSSCNLTSPGHCEELLNDAAKASSNAVASTILAVASAVTLAVMLLQIVV